MYNSYYLDNLNRQKEKLEEMIRNFQPQPINNFINTNQTPPNALIEMRILNENEEVDNLYVSNKTLFINDENMVIKDTDGKLEKWEIKKIYPIDKKDQKISELEDEIKKLKEKMNDEYTKPIKSNGEFNKSNGVDDVNVESRAKTTSKSVSKQD